MSQVNISKMFREIRLLESVRKQLLLFDDLLSDMALYQQAGQLRAQADQLDTTIKRLRSELGGHVKG